MKKYTFVSRIATTLLLPMKTALLLLSGALLAASTLPGTAAERTPESASTPFLKSGSDKTKMILAPGNYDLVVIGDSIVYFWRDGLQKQFAPWKVLPLGHGGEHTENILYRLQNGELEGVKAKAVMILIGTNNIGHTRDQPEWIAAGVKEIVKTVQTKIPGARVLVMGIFPRGYQPTNPKTGQPDSNRKRIADTNELLAGLADGKTVTFLDIGSKFMDTHGVLTKEIFRDGLHPTGEGYKIWAENARPKLEELMKAP